MTEARILVTGSAGFVGSHLRKRVISHGVPGTWMWTDLKKVPVSGKNQSASVNILDEEEVQSHVRSFLPTHVIHLAAYLGKSDDTKSRELAKKVNVDSVATLVNVLSDLPEKPLLLFPSTGLVYGNQSGPFQEDMAPQPKGAYAESKYAAEGLITNADCLRSCILRPSVLYGPDQNPGMFIPSLVYALATGKDFPMTPGEQFRDFLWVEDLADLMLRCLTRSLQGIYNASFGVSYTMKQVAEMMGQISGKKSLIKIGALDYRENESWDYSLDNKMIQEISGWSPTVDVQEGLKRLWQEAEK